MSDQKSTALTALTGANLHTGDLIDVVDTSDTTMDASGTNKTLTPGELFAGLLRLGNTSLGTNVASGVIDLGAVSDTTSRPLQIRQTWNNAGLTATALRVSATITAANAASLLLDLRGGAAGTTTVLSVGSTGTILPGGSGIASLGAFNNGFNVLRIRSIFAESGSGTSAFAADQNYGIGMGSAAEIGFQAGAAGASFNDTISCRDAADVWAHKRGTNNQTVRIYGTTTGSRYLNLTHNGTNAVISVNGGGAVHITNLPTSNPGPGILWNNAGTPAIGT